MKKTITTMAMTFLVMVKFSVFLEGKMCNNKQEGSKDKYELRDLIPLLPIITKNIYGDKNHSATVLTWKKVKAPQ